MNTNSTNRLSLYEQLSLTLGQSFGIQENCEKFFEVLFSVKDLVSSSVWIEEKYLTNNEINRYLTQIYTVPKYDKEKLTLNINHDFYKQIKSDNSIVLSAGDNFFDQIFLGNNTIKADHHQDNVHPVVRP